MLLTETHLPKNGILDCPGYTVYVHNRAEQHRDAPTASGGVAILVKNDLFKTYKIEIIDKSIDGILGIICKNKETHFTSILYACYLPPQNSPWGRDAPSFFAHLISELYLNKYADFVLYAGDFYSRIGNLSGIDENIDTDVPPRIAIDLLNKDHGHEFIEFSKDAKMAVLNGRIDPENANFTNVKRGRSVVDYMLVPHDCLTNVTDFKVDLANVLVDDCNVYDLVGDRSKIPDHSMLTTRVNWGYSNENVMNSPSNHINSEPARV